MGRIFTIDPGLPFLDVLAAAIQRHWMTPDDPLKATDVTILLPTNRACRALRDAFLRVGDGQALLLPKILPLGETSQEDSEDPATLVSAPGTPGGGSSNQTDDPLAFTLPPPIGDLQRRFLLARLVAAKDPSLTEDQALRLAADLGGLLDRVQAERLSWDRLATLVPEGLSDHWQHALTFLTILAQIWPTLLAERHLSDPAQWRDALQRHRAGSWSHRPPGPVIAAGSTGSQPGTADLLATIAALPEGWVVLPGLDREMADEDWAALEDTHPQANLARLCQRLGTARQQVETLPGAPDPGPASTARRRLVAQALRPAATTDAWSRMPPTLPAALEGLTRLDAPSPREEATAIALMLRQTLDSPGRTAALITPDRPLARRVAAALDRWGVAVDDSAGQPLSSAIPGRLLILSATAALDGFGPLSLMALLRHPLVALGEDPSDFRDKVRLLDRTLLRGPRPADGLAELAALAEAAAEHRPALRPLGPWLQRLAACAAPFAALTQETRVDPSHFAETHMRFCEALADARIDGAMIPGALRLWTGDAGEAAARFATELAESLIETGSPDGIAPRRWPAVLEAAMEGRVVRPGRDLHSRLFIWGPLEARLQRPDLVVLGGLNEDTWPAAVDPGPWMSRPMMHSFGLPPPERRIGLAAHDFAQLIAAPEVVLSRAAKVDGTPTRPSRWLLRLDAATKAAGLEGALEQALARGRSWIDWAEALDKPDGPAQPTTRPAPTPPVKDRPRQLPVTAIETWRRDPYGLYARRLLKLRALDPMEADPAARDKGELIHAALEAYARAWPERIPDDPEAILIEIGQAVFAPHLHKPGVLAFWWPRFQGIAQWMAGIETKRRPGIRRIYPEVEGELVLQGPAGPFRLTAKADRIDLLDDGTLAIIDYKTGTLPSPQEVETGFAPQLPLEAAIAEAGGFVGIPAAKVSELAFWKPRGDRKGGEIRRASTKDPSEAARIAWEGLSALIASYDRAETAYPAVPHPAHAPKYNDYQHLARVQEWAEAPDDSGSQSGKESGSQRRGDSGHG